GPRGCEGGREWGRPWQRLYFLREPQGQGALRETSPPPDCWAPVVRLAAPVREPGRAPERAPERVPGPDWPRPRAGAAGAESWTRTPPEPASPSMTGAEYWSCWGGRTTPRPLALISGWAACSAGASSTWTSRLNRNPTASSLMPSSICRN